MSVSIKEEYVNDDSSSGNRQTDRRPINQVGSSFRPKDTIVIGVDDNYVGARAAAAVEKVKEEKIVTISV